MKGQRVCIILCVIAVVATSASAVAQDFQQLLSAVDRVEANLRALVEKESVARAAEIAKLRKELAGGSGVDVTGEVSPMFAQFQRELDSLRVEVGKLSAANQQIASADLQGVAVTAPTAEQVTGLTDGLASLNERLESYLASGMPTPKSEVGGPAAGNTPEVLPGVNLFGFVNASAVDDRNKKRSTFGVDETELDIEHSFSDKAAVRADIEYVNDGSGEFNMDVEQAYLSCNLGSTQKWTFSFGKFNAPIGFESVDAPARYQHSYAAISTYSVPCNLTGASLFTQFSPVVDAVVYLCNGWDVNSDNNSGKTIGMRWGVSPTTSLNFGLSVISGPEQTDRTDSRRSVFDMDLTYQITPTFLLGGEINYGMESKILPNGDDAKWYGFLLMSNIELSSNVNVTLRTDYFKDDDGFQTGTSHDLKAFTIAPRLKVVDGLEGLVEIKYEFSNHDVFFTTTSSQKAIRRFGPAPAPLGTETYKNNRLLLAAEMTYRF